MKKLLLALLLVPTFAFAEYSVEEETELLKIVNSAVQISRAQESVGQAIPLLNQKAETLNVAKKIYALQWRYKTAFDMMFSAESNGQLTREQEVAQLLDVVPNIDNARLEILALLNTLPNINQINTAKIRVESAAIPNFNSSLSYMDYRPANFPTMIGPHGDYELSHSNLEHMTQYTIHTLFDGLNLWENTSLGSTEDVKDFVRHNGRALSLMYRTWGMAGGLVLPDDVIILNGDVAAGSGLRPFDFFRVLLEIEYIFTSDNSNNFAGRDLKQGATIFVRQFADAFTRMVQTLTPEEKVQQFTGRHGAVSNVGPNGWATEFYFDLSDFWTALDGYGAAVMLFIHEIVGPPAGGGQQLVCGAGTHQEGIECVPDPIVCPEYVASLEFVDNITAQARCLLVLQ